MANRSLLTIRGWVATAPVVRVTASGAELTTFRIADSVRRRDPDTGAWRDVKTTWYTVEAWGDLGKNLAGSLRASEAVVVIGHPSLHQWEREDGASGTRLVLEAETVGHDLRYGFASFTRRAPGRYVPGSDEPAFAGSAPGGIPGFDAVEAESLTPDVLGADSDGVVAPSGFDDDEETADGEFAAEAGAPPELARVPA